jgi:hypothetical protein
MSILDSMLNAGQMGEPDRLDYAIRENENLKARFDALLALLLSSGVITSEQAAELAQDSPES